MDIKKVADNWLASAEDDWRVAGHLMEKGDYAYALFFCHLHLEKTIKALIVQQTGEHSPFGHDLEMLSSKLNFTVPDEYLDSLRKITLYNISARYPEDREKILRKFNQDYADKEIHKAKEISQWLKLKLKY
jgi:HEPN domain-containing protein